MGQRRYQLQLLDYSAGKQNHVCRGVWSSELHNQCDMVEMASIIAGFTLEAAHGPQSGGALVQAMSQGQVPMSIEALTDSYSIFSYLAAAHLKLPAEKGTFYHLAYLRERLVSRLIGSYTWVDTRDMVADGLTKGRADRTALINMMHGNYELDHACHEYSEMSTNTPGDHCERREPVVASSLRVTNAAIDCAFRDYPETEEDIIDVFLNTYYGTYSRVD